MACFHPLDAFQLEDGTVVFSEKGKVARELVLPCGRCIGCRLVRSRSWAIRNVHESQCHSENSYITLTYSGDQFVNGSLYYRDFQLFMKRLRKSYGPDVRFFCCGEYGSRDRRPHFHALIYGVAFDRRERVSEFTYRSRELERLWPAGMCSVGDVNFASTGYVAKYCVKKYTGELAKRHYERLDLDTGEVWDVAPEFGRMSLRKGIGFAWFEKYWKDVFAARDGCIMKGKLLPAPKYYDKLLALSQRELACDKEYDRYIKSDDFKEDCTPERLRVREICAQARFDLNKDKL